MSLGPGTHALRVQSILDGAEAHLDDLSEVVDRVLETNKELRAEVELWKAVAFVLNNELRDLKAAPKPEVRR